MIPCVCELDGLLRSLDVGCSMNLCEVCMMDKMCVKGDFLRAWDELVFDD
jgi:hypothetical protein